MIITRDIAYAYHESLPMIKYPDIEVEKGEMIAVLGRSGSGKTTLLHLLAGLLTPSQGAILIDNQDISVMKGAKKDNFRGKNIGIVFQKPIFAQSLNAIDNLKLANYLSDTAFESNWSKHILETLGIAHLENKKIFEMSMGEQQRLSIARAMVNKPIVLLADEPTSALDDANAAQVLHLLSSLCAQFHTSLVVVTHDNRVSSSIKKQIQL